MPSYWVRISSHKQAPIKELYCLPYFKGLKSLSNQEDLIVEFEGHDIEETLRHMEGLDLEIVEVGTGPFGHERAFIDISPKIRICAPGYEKEDGLLIGTFSSFGSGLHPTTELCIRLLEHLMEQNTIKDVFDLGTGSGILALCAAKLGAFRILASDIMFNACKEASENIKLNGYANKILVVQDSHQVAKSEQFDLVLANLLNSTLKNIMPYIPTLLRPNGFCIFSGLTVGQMKNFLESIYIFQVLTVTESLGWAAALLKKQF